MRRLALKPFIFAYCRVSGVRPHSSWRLFGRPLIQRYAGSHITIGRDFEARSFYAANPLGTRQVVLSTRSRTATIQIGNHVGITGGIIIAETAVTIGDHVFIGNGATIVDTDFHPLEAHHRLAMPNDGQTRAVTIENHAFIGMNALILKGSHIGEGAVVGAGAVVSGTIPPHAVVAGNPAKIVRTFDEPPL